MAALFPSFAAELLFVIVYFLWYYFEIINQVFIAIKNRGSMIKVKGDRFSLLGIYFAAVAILYVSGWFGSARISSGFAALPVWTCYLGILMMIFGESLRQWSTYTLGRYFTGPVVIIKGHKLLIKGPYRFVRHPGYLGGLIALTGIGVAVQSWGAVIAALLIACVAYSYRIYLEEKALRKEFGKQYADYSKRTAMIVPHIL